MCTVFHLSMVYCVSLELYRVRPKCRLSAFPVIVRAAGQGSSGGGLLHYNSWSWSFIVSQINILHQINHPAVLTLLLLLLFILAGSFSISHSQTFVIITSSTGPHFLPTWRIDTGWPPGLVVHFYLRHPRIMRLAWQMFLSPVDTLALCRVKFASETEKTIYSVH